MQAQKRGELRRDEPAAQHDRHVRPQDAANRFAPRRQQGFHLADVAEQLSAVLDIDHPGLGQLQRAGVAVEQTHAERLLEVPHMRRHRRGRNAQLHGGAAETLQRDHAHEIPHALESIHGFFSHTKK